MTVMPIQGLEFVVPNCTTAPLGLPPPDDDTRLYEYSIPSTDMNTLLELLSGTEGIPQYIEVSLVADAYLLQKAKPKSKDALSSVTCHEDPEVEIIGALEVGGRNHGHFGGRRSGTPGQNASLPAAVFRIVSATYEVPTIGYLPPRCNTARNGNEVMVWGQNVSEEVGF